MWWDSRNGSFDALVKGAGLLHNSHIPAARIFASSATYRFLAKTTPAVVEDFGFAGAAAAFLISSVTDILVGSSALREVLNLCTESTKASSWMRNPLDSRSATRTADSSSSCDGSKNSTCVPEYHSMNDVFPMPSLPPPMRPAMQENGVAGLVIDGEQSSYPSVHPMNCRIDLHSYVIGASQHWRPAAKSVPVSRDTRILQRLMCEPDPIVGEHLRELKIVTLKSDDDVRDHGAEFLSYSPNQLVLSNNYTTSMMNCSMHLSPPLQRCRPIAQNDPVFIIPCLNGPQYLHVFLKRRLAIDLLCFVFSTICRPLQLYTSADNSFPSIAAFFAFSRNSFVETTFASLRGNFTNP